MDQLINSLPALLKAAGDTEEVRVTAAVVAWNHVAGEGLRQQTAPAGLYQSRLVVAVADAIWKRQLESMSPQLLFRLNSILGKGVVTFIEFRVDARAVEAVREQRQARENTKPTQGGDVTIPFELVTAAAAIHDSGLRRAFIGAAMSCARRMEEEKLNNAD